MSDPMTPHLARIRAAEVALSKVNDAESLAESSVKKVLHTDDAWKAGMHYLDALRTEQFVARVELEAANHAASEAWDALKAQEGGQ